MPSTMPAMAIPRPVWAPWDRPMSFRATKPKITARTDPIHHTQTIPRTREATAMPFVLGAVATPATGPDQPTGPAATVETGAAFGSHAAYCSHAWRHPSSVRG